MVVMSVRSPAYVFFSFWTNASVYTVSYLNKMQFLLDIYFHINAPHYKITMVEEPILNALMQQFTFSEGTLWYSLGSYVIVDNGLQAAWGFYSLDF